MNGSFITIADLAPDLSPVGAGQPSV
jgi:hypothetical protein